MLNITFVSLNGHTYFIIKVPTLNNVTKIPNSDNSIFKAFFMHDFFI